MDYLGYIQQNKQQSLASVQLLSIHASDLLHRVEKEERLSQRPRDCQLREERYEKAQSEEPR